MREASDGTPRPARIGRLFVLWFCTFVCVGSTSAMSEPFTGGRALIFQDHLDRLGVPYQIPKSGKAILVNIPAFELIAFEDGAPDFRSKVIVGTPWTRTPLLETTTKTVRFRPTWRPTRSMIASGEHRDRIWPPGPQNPLGLAAIRFTADIPVYLHDTNRRELFEQEMRALSHGCVRVQRWDELIAWTLDTTLAEVHRLANGQTTLDVPAPTIPVQIDYFLTFPSSTGDPVTYDDVYQRGAGPVSQGFVAEPSQLACGLSGVSGLP